VSQDAFIVAALMRKLGVREATLTATEVRDESERVELEWNANTQTYHLRVLANAPPPFYGVTVRTEHGVMPLKDWQRST
jgi:hypothetical protein